MAKSKMACALSATALVLGSGILAPAAFAEGGDPFCIDGGDCYSTLQAAFDQVPSDGTPTTIYLDSNEDVVYDGGGAFYTAGKGAHPANGNYNVVFDLKGKTYVIQKDPVGSTGYETQAFHLERGGKFTFKDGTVKAASGSGVWFILQNYADTVLDNVILDGSDNSGITYVASNNFGSLTVKGNSQILASEGKVAFDLWYGMSSVYDGGITVTFGDDFTGKVVGKVEYGRHNRVTDSDWREKAVLNINNGDFDIAFQNGSTGALNGANINISGGVFSAEPDAGYLAEGYVAAEVERGYKVVDPDNMDDPSEEVETYIDEETGEEIKYIAPVQIDYGDWWIEDGGDEENHVSVAVEFGEELIADRKAVLSAVETSIDGLALDENKGGEMLGAVEIDMLDRNGEKIEVKDNALVIYFDIDEETHTKLSAYDKLYVVYFENGVEVERREVYLSDPDEEGYWFSFETTHLSTYAVVGVDEEEEEEPVAATPETGTVTAAGASASVAALMTAVAVGILTSIVSFTYLVRKRD